MKSNRGDRLISEVEQKKNKTLTAPASLKDEKTLSTSLNIILRFVYASLFKYFRFIQLQQNIKCGILYWVFILQVFIFKNNQSSFFQITYF